MTTATVNFVKHTRKHPFLYIFKNIICSVTRFCYCLQNAAFTCPHQSVALDWVSEIRNPPSGKRRVGRLALVGFGRCARHLQSRACLVHLRERCLQPRSEPVSSREPCPLKRAHHIPDKSIPLQKPSTMRPPPPTSSSPSPAPPAAGPHIGWQQAQPRPRRRHARQPNPLQVPATGRRPKRQ